MKLRDVLQLTLRVACSDFELIILVISFVKLIAGVLQTVIISWLTGCALAFVLVVQRQGSRVRNEALDILLARTIQFLL